MPPSKLDYLSKYASGKKSKKKKTKRSRYVDVDEDGDDFIPADPVDDLDGDGPTIVMTDESNALNAIVDSRGLESISRWNGVEAEAEAKPKKRKKNKKKERSRQYDSDDDDNITTHGPFKSQKARATRYDSDDASTNVGKRRDIKDLQKRYDGDNEVGGEINKRKKYDSDGSDGGRVNDHKHGKKSARLRSRRYGSDEEINHKRNGRRWRKRYDSDDGDSTDCKLANHLNDSDDDSLSKTRKMTSGHSAGLQSSDNFRKTEHEIRQKKCNGEVAMERGETIYRNKDGREMPVDAEASQKDYDDKDSDPLWNLGAAQKRKMMEISEERKKMSEGKFSTSMHDVDLYKKDILRAGDPMARQSRENGNKKIYKGPQPKPNRFGIMPGYRWDGIDRGNSFEDEVLADMYAKGRKNEERYKWSCADM